MADWGVLVKSSNGDTLISPDSRVYEFVGEYQPTSRSGNINTYFVPGGEPPLIFLQCGQGNSAGVLSIVAADGGYVVTALSNVGCTAQAFRVMVGDESGYGVASYDRSGRLAFASSRNVLNVRNAGNIAEGLSFPSTSGVDMVSYTCGPVRPISSTTERWEFVTTVVTQESSCQFEPVCEERIEFYDRTECRIVSFFPFVEECTTVRDWRWVTVCRDQVVCRWFTVINGIYARIKRTNWTIQRGTARINSASVSFDWLTHLTGFYDEVLYYWTNSVAIGPVIDGNGRFIPFTPTGIWVTQNVLFEGQLSASNTFPYTTNRANQISLSCLTSVRSNYD